MHVTQLPFLYHFSQPPQEMPEKSTVVKRFFRGYLHIYFTTRVKRFRPIPSPPALAYMSDHGLFLFFKKAVHIFMFAILRKKNCNNAGVLLFLIFERLSSPFAFLGVFSIVSLLVVFLFLNRVYGQEGD